MNNNLDCLVFKNIKYAGVDFNSVYFLFQSYGINSYFNACIFILNAKTKKEAIDKQDEMRALLSKKYNLYSFFFKCKYLKMKSLCFLT